MPMKPLITITTDFGDQFAVAQLRAVLASLGFNGQLIENHDVTPFSILEGAFRIDLLSKFVPSGTVHLGIIDPGVGSSRRGVVLETRKAWFVGPDNGLFYQAATRQGIKRVWGIDESLFSDVSSTFHGRDIFIKLAAFLSSGNDPAGYGCVLIDPTTLVQFEFKNGQVVHVDRYGNIKIYWSGTLPKRRINVTFASFQEAIPIVKTFTNVQPGKPLAYLGSSNMLELAVNLGRGDHYFGLKVGDQVKIA